MKPLLLLVSFISLAMFGCKPNCSDVQSADIGEKCERTADCMNGLRCWQDFDGFGRATSRRSCMPGGEFNEKICPNKRLSAYGESCRINADCAGGVPCVGGLRCFSGWAVPEAPRSAYIIPSCSMLSKHVLHLLHPTLGPVRYGKEEKKTKYSTDHGVAYRNMVYVCGVGPTLWRIAQRKCLYAAKSRKALLACGEPGKLMLSYHDHVFKGRGVK